MTSDYFSELSKLPTSEKIQLVERLWNNIRKEHPQISVPNSHKQELDKRFQTFSPESSISLQELKKRMEKRK